MLDELTTMFSMTIIHLFHLFLFCWLYFKTCFFSHFPKRIIALEKQLAKFHLQCTADHTEMHTAPPAEKCVMADLCLAGWKHAMASGSFTGFPALEYSRHSIPFSSWVFLFVCLFV